jgi:bifunctional glutamyl/prolyl-tRNA synthetase
VDVAVKELLALKGQYKTLTGSEYKPSNASASASGSAQKENKKPASAASAASVTSSSSSATSGEAEKLAEKITEQGDKVRELKANKSTPKVSKIVIRLTSES